MTEKEAEQLADGTARSTGTSISSSHIFLTAAEEVMNGANWQTDAIFSSMVVTRLFGSMEWWQGQIDMCQLAVEVLQDRLTDYAKLLREHMTKKRPEQIAITESMINETKTQLDNYKRWEDICIGQMRKIGMHGKSPSTGGL